MGKYFVKTFELLLGWSKVMKISQDDFLTKGNILENIKPHQVTLSYSFIHFQQRMKTFFLMLKWSIWFWILWFIKKNFPSMLHNFPLRQLFLKINKGIEIQLRRIERIYLIWSWVKNCLLKIQDFLFELVIWWEFINMQIVIILYSITIQLVLDLDHYQRLCRHQLQGRLSILMNWYTVFIYQNLLKARVMSTPEANEAAVLAFHFLWYDQYPPKIDLGVGNFWNPAIFIYYLISLIFNHVSSTSSSSSPSN